MLKNIDNPGFGMFRAMVCWREGKEVTESTLNQIIFRFLNSEVVASAAIIVDRRGGEG